MIFLVWYLISSGRFDFKALAQFFHSDKIVVILVALISLVLVHLLLSVRYRFVVQAIGYLPRLRTIFNIVMVGLFYNNFLPGGTGGDLMRIYYLKKREGIPIAEGTASTLLDRMLAMLGLVFVAITSVIIVSQVNSTGAVGNMINGQPIILGAAMLIPICVIGGLFLLRIQAVYNFIERILSKFIFGTQLISFMKTFQLLALNTKVVLASFGLSLIGHSLIILTTSLIAYAMYGMSAFYATMATAGLIFLTNIIPITPGNIGLTEWLADNLFRLFGVEGGANVFAMWRVVMVLFSLFGGIIYLYSGGKKEMGVVEESATPQV
ncbi:MAG: flippase-like domain-containing protein [Deferribacteraceae bacterium]|jgi:uncharacterized protein (TIRG00374 family)|nr:flippase-like domain-containing protein [Deferribacteraceae bacterium]